MDKFPDLVTGSGESEVGGEKCIRIFLKVEKLEKREKDEILSTLVETGYPKQYPLEFEFSGMVVTQLTPPG